MESMETIGFANGIRTVPSLSSQPIKTIRLKKAGDIPLLRSAVLLTNRITDPVNRWITKPIVLLHTCLPVVQI
jgi:hypothetical protein